MPRSASESIVNPAKTTSGRVKESSRDEFANYEHVFIRADKSVEKPKTIFFHDEDAEVIISHKPFTKNSMVTIKRNPSALSSISAKTSIYSNF